MDRVYPRLCRRTWRGPSLCRDGAQGSQFVAERFAWRVFERLRPELCAHTLMLLRRFRVAWIPNANGVGPFCVCGLHARFRVRALPRGLAEWVGVRIVLRLNIPIAYL